MFRDKFFACLREITAFSVHFCVTIIVIERGECNDIKIIKSEIFESCFVNLEMTICCSVQACLYTTGKIGNDEEI